jgi:hypothetical protein
MYMLYSIQDVYTFNFVQGFVLVLLTFLMKKITGKFKHCGALSYFLHKEFKRSSFVWGLLSVTIENNIGNIVYYGAIQFHVFFYNCISDKLNLVFTLIILLISFFYCYSFYHLAYRYSRKKKSK